MFMIKTIEQIEWMRISGKILADTFRILEENVKPGISTKQLDKIAHDYIISRGAKPSCLHYMGFPASICTSVDSVVVHGIPSEKQILQEGQIISIDICVKYKGFSTDAARTYAVGNISPQKQRLIDVTKASFFEGISGLKAGVRLGDVGAKIQNYVEKHGYSVVRDFVGHGVGKDLHEDPAIPNFGRMGTGVKVQAGMTLAIEPMVNEGDYRVECEGLWNVTTKDGKPSAHYENTVLITEEGIEILTI